MSKQTLAADDGKVIAFVPPPGWARRTAEGSDGQRGVILLFTGVRYERGQNPAPAGGSGPGKRARAGA